MQTHIDLSFGDGVYKFQLGMGQIIAIEDKCGPIGEVYRRVVSGRYSLDGNDFGNPLEGAYRWADLLEICRQGLMGGKEGMVDEQPVTVTDHLANQLVRTYLYPENGNPITKAWDVATAVLHACIAGYSPAEEPKKKAPRKARNGSTAAKSSVTES